MATVPKEGGLDGALDVFDSADSRETIIYLVISLAALIVIGILLKFSYWVSERYKFPGWKLWSVSTRQKLAILWTTSTLSIVVVREALYMLFQSAGHSGVSSLPSSYAPHIH